ncbi:MAG: DinB family protein [Acidimicrobiales bacterium]
MTGRVVDEQLAAIEVGWRRLRQAVESLGPEGMDRRTSSGWTVKELVAHLAFWEETTDPVINGMLRGDDVPLERWYGGAELGVTDGQPWPDSSVHNAREAAWARDRPAQEVMARWDRSHSRLLAVVATITEEEAAGTDYLGRVGIFSSEHYAEHLSEVEALLA